MSDDADAWRVVSSKSRRAVRGKANKSALAAHAAETNLNADVRAEEESLAPEVLAERAREAVRKVTRAVGDVEDATFTRAAIDCVVNAVRERRRERVVTALVLGLGSPATSAGARMQLAFAILLTRALKHEFGDDCVRVKARDPCFTLVDEAVLRETCGGEAVAESASRALILANSGDGDSDGDADEFVVFYMPHCEGDLYESVVRARWSATNLRDLVCVGNTFTTYADRWAAKNVDPSKKRPSHVIAASTIVKSALIDPGDTFTVQGAFNDTSVHSFDIFDDDAALPDVEASLGEDAVQFCT